jgi:hypothetical protein
MIFLKRLLLAELLLLFVAMPAMATEGVTARAMKLYEKHRYEEAARLLRPEIVAMDAGRQAEASLALGMIYLGSAMLYRELYQAALTVELDYLTQLRKQKSATPSRYVDLYLGQILLETGRPADGAKYLRQFSERKGAEATTKSLAEIELGLAYNRQKQSQKAWHEWSKSDSGNPEIKAALAGAYAAAGMQDKKPVSLADAALNDTKSQHHTPGARMLRNLLRAYSDGDAPEKALELLSHDEINSPAYVEDLGSSKMISFYDASLLDDSAKVNLSTAVRYLEQASRDTKTRDTATFYLADAYLQQGNAVLSLRSAADFLSKSGMPQQYRNIALVNQASAQNMAGRHAEANAAWLSLAEKSTDDPASLAAVMSACAQAGGDCTKLEKFALGAIEKGEGKKYFSLNAALGKYYLLHKDYPKAMLYIEAGRDKANKNRIEINDPLMLVGLAEAYYRNKKFSENLEIYFEIGKQYPLVRQIQDAMQGIYAMEQQSAGDVKIF